MAATKTLDHAAAKQAKQKKILIALSIVLVAVLAIQLPRLMGGGGSEAAPATDTTGATADPAAVTTDPAAVAAGSTTPTAPVAPATLTNGPAPAASEAQLASFSLFESKDPFVQQLEAEQPGVPGAPGAGGSAAAKPGVGAKDGPSAGGSASGGAGAGGGTAEPKPTLAFATISVGGDAESVGLKDEFPKEEPMFVLASLKERSAQIGIAGGSLAKGKTVKLVLGKKLTLVNTATGARYTLQLLYTGEGPEETAAFSAGEPAEGASTDTASAEPNGTATP